MELSKANGKHCVTCSQQPIVASCGPTCPLKRTGSDRGWYQTGHIWIYFAAKDVQLFDKLEQDVNTYGTEANSRTVREWEVIAKDLLKQTEDSPNRFGTLPINTEILGFDKDWTFQGHWGQGSVADDDVAPDNVEESGKDKMRVER